MTLASPALLALLVAATPPQAQSSAGRPEDEAAIRATIGAFAQAFGKGDARAIAQGFAEEGEAVDPDGATILGRKAIEEHYAARFAAGPGDTLKAEVESIRFLAPGVARAVGRTRVAAPDGGPISSGRYSALFARVGDRWLVASLRELPGIEEAPHEHLKELEWLVGDWVEETEDAVVRTSVAWSEDRNYLIRTFDVRVAGKPALTGSQRIGWDPLTGQIKSWLFDSQGGYGDGLWTRSGNHWVIKASGVRPDGRLTTATQVLTFVDKDHLRWRSLDRTLGADVAHDIDEIVMVRKPPAPK